MAADSEFTALVRRLGCLKGISTLTGFALAVEIGDWSRFTGNTIGSFVGLVPSEHSSGSSRAQGPITKAGNTHARRLLVEAAWHHRAPYRPTKTMRDRWDLATPAARVRGDAGNRRLHNRWIRFNERKKKNTVANTRHRPRARWLVLVPGRLGGVAPHKPVPSIISQMMAAHGATRATTMSSPPPHRGSGDARR